MTPDQERTLDMMLACYLDRPEGEYRTPEELPPEWGIKQFKAIDRLNDRKAKELVDHLKDAK